MKIGDTVRYIPVMLAAQDAPCEGVILDIEPQGAIFKMTMIVINTVDHWIPAHECKVI